MPLSFLAESASRKRKAFLSRGEIVEAAARIMARDGYDALNMRSLASRLKVQAAALYRHLESREELDDLLFDYLIADLAPVGISEDWREDVRRFCTAWRSHLIKKRDATRIALRVVSIGPHLAPFMEAFLSTLRRSGLDDAGIIDAYESCLLFVHGFASLEATNRIAARPPPAKPQWINLYPTLAELSDKLSAPFNYDAQFRFCLDALIDGIDRRSRQQ